MLWVVLYFHENISVYIFRKILKMANTKITKRKTNDAAASKKSDNVAGTSSSSSQPPAKIATEEFPPVSFVFL